MSIQYINAFRPTTTICFLSQLLFVDGTFECVVLVSADVLKSHSRNRCSVKDEERKNWT